MRKKLDEYVAITMEQRIDFLEKDRGKIRRENERLKKEIKILRGELKRQKELLRLIKQDE